MPSLPRIRRSRGRTGVAEAAARPRIAELSAQGLTWVHVNAPDQEVATELAERFGWHPLDVEDILSKRQRPKVDDYPEYLFAVLHFPWYDSSVQRLNAAELDIVLGPDYLVTMPNVPLLPVDRLFNRCAEDEEFRERALREGLGPAAVRGARRPLRLLLPDPRQDRAQARQDRGRHPRGALRGARARHLERQAGDHLLPQDHQAAAPDAARARAQGRALPPEELELYFDDIVDASERIWDVLDNYKEVVEALEDTNESVIAHRHNDVLRVLTVFSVILLPLTLIASVFGMNVVYPGEGTHAAFWVIIAIMVLTIFAMLGFFRWKRWLSSLTTEP